MALRIASLDMGGVGWMIGTDGATVVRFLEGARATEELLAPRELTMIQMVEHWSQRDRQLATSTVLVREVGVHHPYGRLSAVS